MQFLLSQCHFAFTQHSGILFTLLLAGLVSGFTHCAGMCGPFVVAQAKCSSACGSETQLKKLSGLTLLPYHLGRMTTYMLLGATAALIAKQVIGTPFQQWLAITFLTIAGMVFVLSALPKSSVFSIPLHPRMHVATTSLNHIAKPLFKNPHGIRGYGLGALLGLLPCGVIFAALMVVATTGNPFIAMLAMALFTIGTFPALLLIGIGSRYVYKTWPGFMRYVAQGVMVFNGINLFTIAGKLALT